MRGRSWIGVIVFAPCVALLVSGCSDKLTRARYEMIVVNTSTKYDVEKTLGEPSTKLDDQWHYERVDKDLNVFVGFNDDGVVTRKQWIERGVWEDTEEAPADRSQFEKTTIRKMNEDD